MMIWAHQQSRRFDWLSSLLQTRVLKIHFREQCLCIQSNTGNEWFMGCTDVTKCLDYRAWEFTEVFKWYMQASQTIDPEVHSQREWGLQGPDPPAFLDLVQARIMAVCFVDDHHGHVCLRVHVGFKMCRHRGIFNPPMHDVKMMTVDPAMKGLSHFAHILLATPPACD